MFNSICHSKFTSSNYRLDDIAVYKNDSCPKFSVVFGSRDQKTRFWILKCENSLEAIMFRLTIICLFLIVYVDHVSGKKLRREDCDLKSEEEASGEREFHNI